VALLTQGRPDVDGLQAAAAAMGLHVDLPDLPATLVWPENWRPFLLFCEMQTQWRIGAAGPVGLEYASLPVWCRPGQAGSRRGRRVAAALQAMEGAALEHWATKRELNT
jgi:hypothetical protein